MPEDLGYRLNRRARDRGWGSAPNTALMDTYGLIDTDRGDRIIFHLGMSGRWRVDPGELLVHDHLILETE